MNKTININLGGFFFHIDENAYQKLKRYLEAIARSLSDDPQGKNEIISDIEARISELLSERITDARQVVNEGDIDEIIAIMGQPEDYSETEESYSNDYTYKRRKTASKKLFRDTNDKFLGGVASGLAHYTNIDIIWVRLAFIVLVASGFSPLVYILLWVLLPEAKTTSEKLQMQGEPVNIDSIEKKIRDEIEFVSTKLKNGANELTDKISSADYDKLKNQTKSGLQDFLDTLGKILATLFKIFGKFIGALLIFVAGIVLISFVIALFSMGSIEILGFDEGFIEYPPFFYDSLLPNWLLSIFVFLAIGIPFLALLILGLRILSPNIKKLSTATSLSLFGVWLVSIFFISFAGIEFATSKALNGVNVSKENISVNKETPLKIAVQNNDNIFYLHNLERRDNAEEVYVDDSEAKYSNNVKISIKKSDSDEAYIEIRKESEGRKRNIANGNAEKIRYNFKQAENKLVFDAYFLSNVKNIWKDEEVYITINIPEGTPVFFENSSKYFLYRINNIDDIYESKMANHNFEMTSKGFKCIDCKNNNDSDNSNNESSYDDNEVDNDKDITFLFDSTINDFKAEFHINKNTTKNELEKLIRWFKNKQNIDIEIVSSKFNKNKSINKIHLNIDCNDGYKGEIKITNGTLDGIPVGFRRLYNTEDENLAFKIWGSK